MRSPCHGGEDDEQLGGWTPTLRRWLVEERSPVELLAHLWGKLKGVNSRLGRFAGLWCSGGVPPEASASTKWRSDDLFPIDPASVAAYLRGKGQDMADGVSLMVNSLNYLALASGSQELPDGFPSRDLTSAQESTVDHLVGLLEHLEESGKKCPGLTCSAEELNAARFDYTGEAIMPMEDLSAEKVIAAWPPEGQAAVQDALDFVPADLKSKLLEPSRCLLPLHEWPEEPPCSRVRATSEEWSKIVEAAYKRGLMVAVDPEEVFKHNGKPVLHGAGAVKKVKVVDGKEVRVQRFISNLIPSNTYQERLEGDDHLLPYLGQLTLLEQEEGQVFLVDSEDFVSCFNLFKLPPVWHRYMAFGKLVDAKCLGGEPGKMVYPAMAVLPMGWISSVAVIQSIVRTLVFKEAGVSVTSEVAKTKVVPQVDDFTVIYLDSYDQLRRLDKGCAEILEGQLSDRHHAFLEVCRKKGLPLNEGKRLIAATKGTLQGGELDGVRGQYGLARDKMAGLIGLGGALLACDAWSEQQLRHFIGKAVFGMCFRRPIFSVLQNVFDEVERLVQIGAADVPSADALDEIFLVVSLVPLMVTNLKARIDDQVSITDASPSGAGAAVATRFRPPPLTLDVPMSVCYECGRPVAEDSVFPCPAECMGFFCSLACVMAHREPDHVEEHRCPRHVWRPPKFGERFAGRRAPLSHAVAMVGHLEVQPPYDLHFGNDMFTDQGREELKQLTPNCFASTGLLSASCSPRRGANRYAWNRARS